MKTKQLFSAAIVACVAGAAGMFVSVGGGDASEPAKTKVTPMDLSSFAAEPPGRPLELLFIHHSCGAHMLADPGPEQGAAVHPNGGGGKAALERAGYTLNEAGYGSKVGEDTDLFHWLPKFRSQWSAIRTTRKQDEPLPEGRANDIVMFKSCYPNSDFVGAGEAPGNAAGPDLTVANAKATMIALREELATHPETLFVYVTAPPRTPNVGKEKLYLLAMKKVLGKPTAKDRWAQQARWTREFNDWVTSADGWLKGYPHQNLVVFDAYGILTGGGESNHLRYVREEDPFDSHPSSVGNRKVAEALVPFLNRAVRRAKLAP